MRFDIIGVARRMKQVFGTDGEIIVRPTDHGIDVRLRVFKNNDVHTTAFEISEEQMSNACVDAMNERYRYAIAELERYVANEVGDEANDKMR